MIALIGLLLLLPLHAEVDEKIQLKKIERVNVSSGYHVVFSKGSGNLSLSGSEEQIETLKIEKEHGVLNISAQEQKEGWFSSWFGKKSLPKKDYNLAIHISLDHLDSLYLYGNSSAVIKDDLKLEKIELSGNSTLDIRSPLHPRMLDIQLRGSSLLATKSISTGDFNFEIGGSSRALLSDLHAHRYGSFNIHGGSSLEATMIQGPQLVLEGSGRSSYRINTIQTNDLFLQLHGANDTNVKKINTKKLLISANGSSSLKIRSGQAYEKHVNKTGIASIYIDNVSTTR